MPVVRKIVQETLGSSTVSVLQKTGLVHVSKNQIRSDIRIQPFEGLYFVVDPPFSRGKPDDVLGIGPSGRVLSSLTIRRTVRTALDLGCGCGLQALLASRHAEKVIAVDLNPRAVRFSEFNVQLNGVTNVEVRPGDLFEPVSGESFDLIVCNPPFVVSPEQSLIYRDSGLPVNGLVRRILSQLPHHLEDGGFGHITCHWAHRNEGEWWGPIHELIAKSGCDTWLAHQFSDRTLDYAIRWNKRLLSENPRRYRRTLRKWSNWYRKAGIIAITSAFVTFGRQTNRQPWMRAGTVSENPSGMGGEQLMRIFAAQNHLSMHADAEHLLDARFNLANGTELIQRSVSESGDLKLQGAEIRCQPGIGAKVMLDADMTKVLLSLDRGEKLNQTLARVSRADRINLEALTKTALPMIRRLYGLGMLDRASID
jgi:methylase of polypeptide subunit release factors